MLDTTVDDITGDFILAYYFYQWSVPQTRNYYNVSGPFRPVLGFLTEAFSFRGRGEQNVIPQSQSLSQITANYVTSQGKEKLIAP